MRRPALDSSDARVDVFAAPWSRGKPMLTDTSRCQFSLPTLCQHVSLFEPQTFRDGRGQSVEEELHQQREQGSGNCALQNRASVIQIEPADNWFSQSTDPDECGQRSVPTSIIALVFISQDRA